MVLTGDHGNNVSIKIALITAMNLPIEGWRQVVGE
jgi:hypothetical protein